jgi:hypothetical protein
VKSLRFYIFMIIFFGACIVHDGIAGTVTGFSFGWVFAMGYYIFRYREVKQMLEDSQNDQRK